MRFISNLSFRAKIGLGTAVIVILATLVSGLPAIRMAADALMGENQKRGRALSRNLALHAVEPLLQRDLLRLKNMVDEIKTVDPDMDYAFILDTEGQVLAHTFLRGFPVELRNANHADFSDGTTRIRLLDTGQQSIYDFAAPVMVEGIPVGTVRVGLSRSKVERQVNRLLWAMGALAGSAMFLAILAATVFSERVTRRINLLRRYAEAMVTGDLEPETTSLKHINCWETNNCTLVDCPAHGDVRRRCWYLAGTLCPDCDDGKLHNKLESCRTCPVFRRNRGDEIQDLSDTFDVMALSLKNHISELRRADKEIRKQERLLRTVLDVTPDLVSLQDADMVYQAVNKGFADFVGRTPNEATGATDRDLFKDNGRRLLSDEARAALITGRGSRREVRVGESWFDVVLIPVEDQEGRVIGVLRSARDITEIKQVQAQLVQAQKMESLGKLAGGVAHEINTPLGIILGYAQLLQDDFKEGEQVREDLKVMEKQAKVCRQIVADLLGFSRNTESSKREMCFNNSLMEAVSLVRHTFEMDNVHIETVLDDRMPIIYGDPEKLKQVWINLLNNARDAMKGAGKGGANGAGKGGGSIVVRSVLDFSRLSVTAQVADTGSGISSDNLKKIFDPFFTTKSVGEGTGLGLSVSFGIIEDHQGTIEALSPVPKGMFAFPEIEGESGPDTGPGTVFTVELPLDHGPEEAPNDIGETDSDEG